MTEPKRFPWCPPELSPAAGDLPVKTTASACVVDAGRVLLEKRPPGNKPAAGLWDTPGGHLEAGETPEAALVRELEEELGIRATHFRLGTVQDEQDRPTGFLYRHYLFILTRWTGKITPREGQHVAWFPLSEVLDLEDLNPLVGVALGDFLRAGWIGEESN